MDTMIGPVHLLGSSFKEMKRGMKSDVIKAKLVPFVPEILKTGRYDGRTVPHKPRMDFVAFHFFRKTLVVNGLTVAAGVNVAERLDGNLAYGLGHEFMPSWVKREEGTLNGAGLETPTPLLALGNEPMVEAGVQKKSAPPLDLGNEPRSGADYIFIADDAGSIMDWNADGVNIIILSVTDVDGNPVVNGPDGDGILNDSQRDIDS